MAHTHELLQAYARSLRRLARAGSATLYVSTAPGDTHPTLVHEGELPPAPELADAETAASFDRSWSPPGGDTHRTPAEPQVMASHEEHCRLIRVPFGCAQDPGSVPERDARAMAEPAAGGSEMALWIGLRFDPAIPAPTPEEARALVELPETGGPPRGPWQGLLGLGTTLAGHARLVARILHDRVTGLPGRAELQEELLQTIVRARDTERAFSLLLINPDGFGEVNRRFGRDDGDRALREIAARIRSVLRHSDRVYKFGAAIFTCVLPDTPGEHAGHVGAKLLGALSGTPYLGDRAKLQFSMGLAEFTPGDDGVEGPLDLIWRADRALNAAKRTGGARLEVWRPGSAAESGDNLDPLTGIFTGNMARDYRNMVLLWDSVNAVAAGPPDTRLLARRLIGKLHAGLKPARTLMFRRDDGGGLTPLVAVPGEAAAPPTDDQVALMEQALGSGRPVLADGSGTGGSRRREGCRVAVPVQAGEEVLGCLWLEGTESFRPDTADLTFLQALGSQMAVAIDRARLAEQEQQRRDRERHRLRAEVDELRRAIQASKLVYRSGRMDDLLATARRIAPTDATVLITGESGTGKELLARTVHELSGRRDRTLVVVDCGAIASTLIDSELFGHVKGAFTGAQERKPGRLTEADGATVLLDEIGELPLEVQTKLLRFVQERQLTPVGGTKPRTVDVRIIAATNVDLAARVREGKFREDLYYRLNVVRLTVPPLRERPDDVLFLAGHFLEKYAATYGKDARTLSDGAATLLLEHDWPGNVRELQNRIMQAVLLSEGVELDATDFRGLQAQRSGTAGSDIPAMPPTPAASGPATALALGEPDVRPRQGAPAGSGGAAPVTGTPLERLRAALVRQIESALSADTPSPLPLGTWLEEDLVLAADGVAGGVARRGATLLGIPETTYRRRLQKTAGRNAAGLLPRPNTWGEVRAALDAVVRSPGVPDGSLLEATTRMLLDEVVGRTVDDTRTSAALMGITQPTFRRRLATARSG